MDKNEKMPCNFWERLFGRPDCNWEIMQKHNVYEFANSARPCVVKIVSRCSVCGEIKSTVI